MPAARVLDLERDALDDRRDALFLCLGGAMEGFEARVLGGFFTPPAGENCLRPATLLHIATEDLVRRERRAEARPLEVGGDARLRDIVEDGDLDRLRVRERAARGLDHVETAAEMVISW